MQRSDLDNRLRELGIYSDFYYRKELKALLSMLGEYEQLNCLLTGVHEGNRKLVAVTDRRILVLFTALGGGDVKIIRRESVKEWRFEKKFLFSNLTLETKGGATFTFTNTQGKLKDLFDWAMSQPLPAAE
ncbi:MAG: PH domain-containing protein [Clostridia bacterium]|nr:PH domain-containing protein [Clostridia bacterium]MBR0356622.1 PH domain-containing protein [Clostridia bacterium]